MRTSLHHSYLNLPSHHGNNVYFIIYLDSSMRVCVFKFMMFKYVHRFVTSDFILESKRGVFFLQGENKFHVAYFKSFSPSRIKEWTICSPFAFWFRFTTLHLNALRQTNKKCCISRSPNLHSLLALCTALLK